MTHTARTLRRTGRWLVGVTLAACGGGAAPPPHNLGSDASPPVMGTDAEAPVAMADAATPDAAFDATAPADGGGDAPRADAGPPRLDQTWTFDEGDLIALGDARPSPDAAPAVAARNDGALVVWGLVVDEVPRLSALRIPAEGGDPGGVTLGQSNAPQRTASAVATDEGYLVVWDDARDGNDAELLSQRISAGGAPVGPAWQLTDNDADDLRPALAIGAEQNTLLAWNGPRQTDDEEPADPLTAVGANVVPLGRDGDIAGPLVRVLEDADSALALAPLDASFFLTFVRERRLEGVRISTLGQGLGEPRVFDDEGIARELMSMATATAGAVAVAYQVQGGGVPPGVRRRLLGTDGTGAGETGPTEVELDPAAASTRRSATAIAKLGDGFVIAYLAATAGPARSSSELVLATLDATGRSVRATALLTMERELDTLALEASPDGRKVYVAWTVDSEAYLLRARCE